eukprot:TRINITY_DN568_c0_g1_i1.p1 TRINITY_DN568_c0_g1~~TRINITY_DN568_c0_g1_i1.p1  ORF type:complete len:393 (-),score=89.16 TRINITY_DN568_c0_g1_i1:46-1224(-)
MTPIQWFVFLLLATIRGTTPIMLQYATAHYSSIMVNLLRSPVTILFFIGIVSMNAAQDPKYKEAFIRDFTSLRAHFKFFSLGLLQQGLPFILIGWSLTHIPAGIGGVFYATVPLFTYIFGQLPCFKTDEKLTNYHIAGLLFGISGVVLILLPNFEDAHVDGPVASHIEGYFVCLSAILMWALSAANWKNANSGKIDPKIHPTVSAFGSNIYASLVCLVAWLLSLWFTEERDDFSKFGQLPAIFYVAIVWISFMSGCVASLSLHYLYSTVGTVKASEHLCLVPIISLVEDVAIKHVWSVMSGFFIAMQIMGTCCVVFGLWLTTLPVGYITAHCPCLIVLQNSLQQMASKKTNYATVSAPDGAAPLLDPLSDDADLVRGRSPSLIVKTERVQPL